MGWGKKKGEARFGTTSTAGGGLESPKGESQAAEGSNDGNYIVKKSEEHVPGDGKKQTFNRQIL